MLPKSQRLTRQEVNNLLKKSQKNNFAEYSLYYTAAPSFKVAVVAPAKIFPKATTRNRFRRQVYNYLKTLTTTPSVHILIRLKKTPAVTTDYQNTLSVRLGSLQ